jgi:glycosyltransferase involved in cell wall biosynthesis
MVATSEFWMPALRKAERAGLRAPLFVKVHQLPYLGTLDVLKTVGVEDPTPVDLVRLPLVASRVLQAPVSLIAFQLAACGLSVRALARRKGARVMAVTPVTSANLRTFGFRRPLFVPPVHVGVEPDRLATAHPDGAIEYDGVYVGRFHPHKGFLDLPLLAAHLRRRLRRDVRIAVCGSPQFARHEETFRRLVRSLRVEDDLVLLGWQSQAGLYETMRRSRALLYPSYVDAFSITVLESLCLGVPVLAYGIDALRMIWSNRAGVFLSPVGDAAAFAEAYADLESIGRFDEARRAMRSQAADLMREYTWERAVRYERDFYEGRGIGG